MKSLRTAGSVPAQFWGHVKLRTSAVIGREYYVAVNRAGDLRGPLFVDPQVCAETTCPGQGLVYKVRVIGRLRYPAKACMKL